MGIFGILLIFGFCFGGIEGMILFPFFTVFRCDFNSDLALDSCIGTVAISLL